MTKQIRVSGESNINVNFLRTAAKKDFMNHLSHEIERKLANLDGAEGLPYGKPDIVQLISSIEKDKVRFLRADIGARQLYDEVASILSQFKTQHPRFDYLNDSGLDAYYS
jgi:hypothetical protein